MFRNDINALRAFAILGVLLFHFNNQMLPGGFVGVDVFFVISGYLMTAIIFKDDPKKFSFFYFLRSRFKRIVPAIIPLSFLVLLVSFFLLTPSSFNNLSESTLASLTFLSNILYWNTSSYFEGSSKENFLLHTWSLSVEWQFYLIYPLILIILRKFLKNQHIKWLIFYFVFISFVFISFYGSLRPVASFYLLPSRAWEMAAGALPYFFTIQYIRNSKYFAFIGFFLILCSFYLISAEGNSWPSFLTLLPVLGALLVLFSNTDTIISTNKILGKIGLYSYSIYLYHWPFLAIGFYLGFETIYLCLMLVLSVFFAILSFYFVERNDSFQRNLVLIIIFFVIIISSTISIVTNGMPNRFDNILVKLDQSRFDFDKNRNICFDSNSKYCIYHKGNVESYNKDSKVDYIFIGDSHAASLVNSFSKAIDANVLFMGVGGCFPLPEFKNKKGNFKNCNKLMSDFSSILPLYPEAKIVVAARYALYIKGSNELSRINSKDSIFLNDPDADLSQPNSLKINSDKITNLFNKFWCETSKKHKLYVIGPVPEFTIHIPNTISKEYLLNDKLIFPEINVKDFYIRNQEVIDMLDNLEKSCNVNVLRPSDILCDNMSCKSFMNDKVIYFDENHLTQSGSDFLIKIFKDLK